MPKKSLPVYAVSLGCPKNRVDTERLVGSLGPDAKLVPNAGRAALVLVNTCAFIEPAARESIRTIIDLVKKIGRLKKRPLLAVAGCLPGRYGLKELSAEFPEVDVWLLPDKQTEWPRLIAKKLEAKILPHSGRARSTGPSYAWLKIAEGCNHNCRFCTIPFIRGRFRSEKMEHILSEAENLLSQGVRELDMVAQDILSYGHDQEEKLNLLELIKRLAHLPGLAWLRLLYLYPPAITRPFLEELACIGAPLLPYFDLPFQHCETSLLSAMGRRHGAKPRETVHLIREIFPDSALRASFIVGYPGETEEKFKRLYEFVEETRFHNVGVFIYYPEEGTPAALLPNQIPQEVKEARRNAIMQLQASISGEILSGYVGSKMAVLVDSEDHTEWPGLHKGRVWFQAPEVDGITYASGAGICPGKMVLCEIVDSQIYDLSAIS